MTARHAAELLWSAWRTGHRLAGLPADVRPRDLDEAFGVQDALADLAGPTYGWKLAATSTAGQAHIGVDGPLLGRLPERFRHAEDDPLPSDDLHMAVVEAEFAFTIGSDVAADADREAVLAAVDSVHPALEFPDSRFVDYATAGAAQLVADQACAGRFVLGAAATRWRELDLSTHPTALLINGTVAAQGSGAAVLGDPVDALCWAATELGAVGRPLRAGDVVTTGTTTVPPTIGPGDSVVADFGVLGTVRATLRR